MKGKYHYGNRQEQLLYSHGLSHQVEATNNVYLILELSEVILSQEILIVKHIIILNVNFPG